MPINSLTIVQDNKVGASNLVSIHNPLSFVCEAFYSGQTPYWIYADILIEGEVVGTYKATAYKDVTGTLRQYILICDDLIRGLMFKDLMTVEPLKDFNQSAETLDYVENLTREVQVQFRDPNESCPPAVALIDACNSVSQYGNANGANMVEQYANQTDTYYCARGGVCYVYFYNDDVNNVLSINGLVETFYAIDANNDIFTDSNNDRFLI